MTVWEIERWLDDEDDDAGGKKKWVLAAEAEEKLDDKDLEISRLNRELEEARSRMLEIHSERR